MKDFSENRRKSDDLDAICEKQEIRRIKAIYDDFIFASPNRSAYRDNKDAQRIFDFLNEDEIIIRMIESADTGRPALAGCVFELEEFYKSNKSTSLDFGDPFTHTVVGKAPDVSRKEAIKQHRCPSACPFLEHTSLSRAVFLFIICKPT